MKFVLFLAALLGLCEDLLAGPLKKPATGCWFTNDYGQAVYLAGWHTWNNFQDMSGRAAVNMTNYLDDLHQRGNNFVRLWQLDQTRWNWFPYPSGGSGDITPLPFARTGPGNAADGGLKFDLSQYNATFDARLTNFLGLAQARGIYVGVMFFEATTTITFWDLSTNFTYSPYNSANNVNGAIASVTDLYTLNNETMTALMDNYVKHVIDVVNDFDNVIYEVINEAQPSSQTFQTHMVSLVKTYEAGKAKQHPIGLTTLQGDPGDSAAFLSASAADWITLNSTGSDPAALSNPTKIWMADTDHIFAPSNGGFDYVWRTFLRGYNNLHMDTGVFNAFFRPADPKVRNALGDTVKFARRMNLSGMAPSSIISSTGYALYNAGQEYLVYAPSAAEFTVTMVAGDYDYEWFIPESSKIASSGIVTASNGSNTFTPPAGYYGGRVLYLKLKAVLAASKGATLTSGTWTSLNTAP